MDAPSDRCAPPPAEVLGDAARRLPLAPVSTFKPGGALGVPDARSPVPSSVTGTADSATDRRRGSRLPAPRVRDTPAAVGGLRMLPPASPVAAIGFTTAKLPDDAALIYVNTRRCGARVVDPGTNQARCRPRPAVAGFTHASVVAGKRVRVYALAARRKGAGRSRSPAATPLPSTVLTLDDGFSTVALHKQHARPCKATRAMVCELARTNALTHQSRERNASSVRAGRVPLTRPILSTTPSGTAPRPLFLVAYAADAKIAHFRHAAPENNSTARPANSKSAAPAHACTP